MARTVTEEETVLDDTSIDIVSASISVNTRNEMSLLCKTVDVKL